MSGSDWAKKRLNENPQIDGGDFEDAQERIEKLLRDGVLKPAKYELDPPSAIPPMVRVDHSATRYQQQMS